MPTDEIAFRVTNSLGQHLNLHLEPWGEQYTISPGATIRVEAKGPDSDILEIEYGHEKITIYGWPGSVVAVSGADAANEGLDSK